MSTEDQKQQKTPRTYDAIERGALSLGLSERVTLRNKLAESIDQELKELEEQLANAKKIVNGKSDADFIGT
jgi:hypothetical protein